MHKREDVPLAVVKAGVFEVWVCVRMCGKRKAGGRLLVRLIPPYQQAYQNRV
jgi:hypothetical protein